MIEFKKEQMWCVKRFNEGEYDAATWRILYITEDKKASSAKNKHDYVNVIIANEGRTGWEKTASLRAATYDSPVIDGKTNKVLYYQRRGCFYRWLYGPCREEWELIA
jgi:hypothetical protein